MVDEAHVLAVVAEVQRALGRLDEAGIFDAVRPEYSSVVHACAGASIVMSYANDEGERAVLERLGDCAWPRGERRSDVHQLVNLAVISTDRGRAEMLLSALVLIDPAFHKLTPTSIEEALLGEAPASRLILLSEALGVGPTLGDEKKRGRQAQSAHLDETPEGEASLQFRLQIASLVAEALLGQARSKGVEPGDEWRARIANAARVLASVIAAGRDANTQRLKDISTQAMSLDERRALVVELLRGANDSNVREFFCISADPRLTAAELRNGRGSQRTRLAAAVVRTQALGYAREHGESQTRAIQRVAKALGGARRRPSRKK